MNVVYPEEVSRLVESINPDTHKKFLFYLPIKTAFNHSFFQFTDSYAELIDLFLKTILLHCFEDQRKREIYQPYLEKEINRIALDCLSSDNFFQQVNYYFKHSRCDIFFPAPLAYFGKTDHLFTDRCPFATQLRSQYRKWLYGLRYDEDIDIGENPIKVLEAIQFFDFLKQPVIYLNHEPIPVS